MPSLSRLRFGSILTLVLPLLLVACNNQTPSGSTNTNRGAAPASAPPIAVSAPNGGTKAAVSAGGTLPADFPPDVPIFPGAKVLGGQSGSGPTGAGASATSTAAATPDAVIAWYKKTLGEAGWIAMIEVPTPGGKSAFYKKDGRTIAVKAVTNAETPPVTSFDIVISDDTPRAASTAPAP